MEVTEGAEAIFATLSREVEMICNAEGVIVWADARAHRAFGAEEGMSLASLVAPGSEEKVKQFLEHSFARSVEGWELTLRSAELPTTMMFRSCPHEGGSAMVGSFVTQDYANVLSQMSATMGEISALHRETDRQQRELLRRQQDLLHLNRQLDDSDKGMVALHAELEEKQDSIRRASEVKSHVMANVSHEFRTPLNSILGLSRLLLDRSDGDLTPEQEKQIGFIRRSAESLSELVNDILDLSKIEAGKTGLRTGTFSVSALFAALRGMLRPLVGENVSLIFEEPEVGFVLETDESKVAQVLRNLLSNALKFTEKGEVRVSVRAFSDETVEIAVADTGIGIKPEDQARVFDEFVQLDSPLQRRVKGTGLGLSLCAKVAELLGGRMSLTSIHGQGSTFCLRIPMVHPEAKEMADLAERSQTLDPSKAPILVVEDDRQTLFLYEKYLEGSGFQVIPARSIEEARRAIDRVLPSAVVLDIMLEGETSWAFLADLKSNEKTRDIPALVVTVTNREQKARALGADEFYVKPLDQSWLLKRLKALARMGPIEKVLVIDDDEVARYLVRRMLHDTPYSVIEAANGPEGVEVAKRESPQVIFLDFVLPEMTAFDVLDELKKDPRTRSIPVIVHTSKNLADEERRRLALETSAILSKQSLSREVALARIRDALIKAGIGSPGQRKET